MIDYVSDTNFQNISEDLFFKFPSFKYFHFAFNHFPFLLLSIECIFYINNSDVFAVITDLIGRIILYFVTNQQLS